MSDRDSEVERWRQRYRTEHTERIRLDAENVVLRERIASLEADLTQRKAAHETAEADRGCQCRRADDATNTRDGVEADLECAKRRIAALEVARRRVRSKRGEE